jgi:hypothetical protein
MLVLPDLSKKRAFVVAGLIINLIEFLLNFLKLLGSEMTIDGLVEYLSTEKGLFNRVIEGDASVELLINLFGFRFRNAFLVRYSPLKVVTDRALLQIFLLDTGLQIKPSFFVPPLKQLKRCH